MNSVGPVFFPGVTFSSMSTVTNSAPAIARAVVAPRSVTQTSTLGFVRSFGTSVDAVARIRQVNVSSRATALNVGLNLEAGATYNLRGAAGAVAATLVDASGNRQALDFTNAFTVGTKGQYRLLLEGRGAIKKAVDPITIEAKFSEQTATLSFARIYSYDADAILRFKDAQVGANAKKLTVNLTLQAGQTYGFAGGDLTVAGKPKVTLVDAAGQEKQLDDPRSFTVARSGSYQLRFDGTRALAPDVSALSLQAKVTLPGSSGDYRIDALVRGGTNAFWNNADAPAVAGADQITATAKALAGGAMSNVVTYGFLTAATGTSGDKLGFQTMSTEQRDAVRRAFSYYGKLIDVTFKEVTANGTADINLGTNNQRGVSAGYSYYPKQGPIAGKTTLMLANDQGTNRGAGLQAGGYGYLTILHELGHALGLKHPGNYNAGGGGTDGPYLPGGEDNRQNTIMSYFGNSATAGVNPTSAMLYDVAALQYLYGVNQAGSTATAGNFTFTAGQNYLQTLWSGTGRDAINLTGLTNSSRIDLNAGAFSSINIVGSSANPTYSGNNNVAIAYGAKINKVALSAKSGVAESVTLNDAFKSGAWDTITAFNASDDTIALKQSLFGSLDASNIEFGSAATSAASKLIVNRGTGEIFYDQDGNGAGAAQKIAQYAAVQNGTQVSARNFSFVA